MPRIKKKRIIGGGLISMMIVMMFSGCVSKGNPEGASGENISETASMDDFITELEGRENVFQIKYESEQKFKSDTPKQAKEGERVEIKASIIIDGGWHVFVDGNEIERSSYTSSYWGYSFVMPAKDVLVTIKPFSKKEVYEKNTDAVITEDIISEEEQMVPSEMERTGAIGGYFFIPIEGKVFRYNVSSGVVGAKKNKLIFSFVEDASGTSYEHSIYSLEGHDDYRTLADCYKESGSDFTDEVQLEYMPALKSEEGELDKAIESGFVIMENGSVINGKEKWISFYEKVTAGETAEIKLGYYYPLEGQGQMSSDLYEATKEDYPTFYLRELCYDGAKFVIRPLHRGENGYFVYEQKGIDTPETSWKYLKHFTGEPDSTDARYWTYDMYVLVNADDVTWKKIFHGSISSTPGDYIPYDTVFCEYEWK